MMDTLQGVLLALVPSIGIGFLFYKLMKAILEGDRKERLAQARWEAEHSAAADSDGGARAAVGHPDNPRD